MEMAKLLLSLILTVSFVLRVTDGQDTNTASDSTNEPTTQPGPVSISISITASGTNTAGETYSLECSATVTGSTDQPTITWLDPMNNLFPSEMVTTTGSMSTLTFNPLAASHAGTYTCRVTAGGVTETQTSTVIVNVITAQVTRSSSGPLTAGQTGFSLSCDVTGTENLNTPTFTYQWRRNGGVIPGQQGSTLSLSPLTASNTGEYDCSVTVSSTSLSSTVTVNSGNTETLTVHNVYLSLKGVVYPNNSVILITEIEQTNTTSNNGLQCITDRSPCCASSLNRAGEWLFPDGGMVPNIVSATTFYRIRGDDGTVNLNRVNNDVMMPTGRFCCVVPDATSTEVTICTNIVLEIPTTVIPSMSTTTNAVPELQSTSSSSPTIVAPPLNVQATQSSASAPVEVSWSPPSSGATNITGYRIFYGNGENVSVPSFVTRIILTLNKASVGETVSVRSEADQLASQLITVTVTTPTEAATKSSRSSALDVGVAVGVMLLLLCVVSVVFTLVLIFIWRKRRVGENDSTNMPTQLYEDPDKLTGRGQGNYELTQCPAYESTTTRPEPPPTGVDQSSHYEL